MTAPEPTRVTWETRGRVWHANCPKWMEGYPNRNPTSGVMGRLNDFTALEDGSWLQLYRCMHCGAEVFVGVDKQHRIVTRGRDRTGHA